MQPLIDLQDEFNRALQQRRERRNCTFGAGLWLGFALGCALLT